MSDVIRRGLLLRGVGELLAEAGGPVPRKEVMRRVTQRVALTDYERASTKSGKPRYEHFVSWFSMNLEASGWMTKTSTGWQLTPAGHQALVDYPGDHFEAESARRWTVWEEGRKARAAFIADSRGARVAQAADSIPSGWWTAVSDLAELSGLPIGEVEAFLDMASLEHPHRIVRATPLSTAVREALEAEGVEVSATGEPAPEQRATAEDLQLLIDRQPGSARAWLVRGSAVTGRNVVPGWLDEGFVSIAAEHIAPTVAGASLDDLQKAVEVGYAHQSYHIRKTKLAELHAFLNRMRVGDAVVTASDGRVHVGRIAGEATFFDDKRTTVRRDAVWSDSSHDFESLPEALKGRLGSAATVVDLTDVEEYVQALSGGDSPVDPQAPTPVPATLPDLDESTIAKLLVGGEWLNEFVDLLRTRRQVILHGPPGTGKTFLALNVAEKLTDPANVNLVQFHPAYSYEDFFEGYRPTGVDESGRVGFALTPGPFRKVVDAAKQNPDQAYVLIVDEINRANLAKVFGEMYFLLEYRDRAIDLMYSSGDEGRDFTLPPNVYLIGTMNTADRSIALVDAAMRRRFAFLSLHPDDAHLRGVLRGWLAREDLPALPADLLDELNSRVPDRDFKIGPSYLMRREAGTDVGLDRIWRTSILPLLEELHYGEAGFDVAARYGLPALRRALPEPAAPDEQNVES
ncbi:MAG: AAA family ATPase [Sporichthyaceae bacterium]